MRDRMELKEEKEARALREGARELVRDEKPEKQDCVALLLRHLSTIDEKSFQASVVSI
jgi:hypothetical protein